MPVPSAISDLSQTAGSNYPAGSESPSTTDDYLRTYASYIAKLRDGQGHTNAVSLASASTTDIGGQTSEFVEISGTTTITSFGTNYNGPRFIRFTGALTLTHNATSLILPTGANITTVAGDTCIAVPNQSLNGWTVYAYAGKSGQFATINAAGGAFNGTVGATTPSTGAFTSLTGTTGKFGTGSLNYTLDAYATGSTIVSSLTSDQTEAWLALKASGTTLGHVRLGATGSNMLLYAGNTTVGTVSSTGLAVTGSLSTTGAITLTGTPASAGASTRYISGGGTSGNFYTNVPTGSNQQWAVNESVVMALLSTGVAVTGTLGATGTITSSTASGTAAKLAVTQSGYRQYSIGVPASSYSLVIRDEDGAADRVVLDTAGNLGLGVTPSAWVDDKAIQLPQGSISSGYEYGISIAEGAYRSSTNVWKYVNSAAAPMRFNVNNAGFQWYTAPSGAAGDAITFTQAMTLDTSGNLLVRQTSTGYVNINGAMVGASDGTNVFNHISGTASGTVYAGFGYNGAGIGSITQNGTTAVAFNTTSDHRLKNNVRPADAARFMDIEFVDFEWVDGRHDCGVIAHQLASVYPDLVLGEKDATETRTVEITPAVKDEEGNVVTPAVTEEQTFPKYQQVNYIGLIGRMGTRIQQLQRTVDAQAEMLAALEARIAALEAK